MPMAIVCARRDCSHGSRPASPDGITRFFTVLCAAGAGHHQGDSSYVHVDCAVVIEAGVVARIDYLPYCQEVAVAVKGGREQRLYERRAGDYYFCGHVGCLVDLLKIYGSVQVKKLLAEAEDGRSPGELPMLGSAADIQLRRALEEVGAAARLERSTLTTRPRFRFDQDLAPGPEALTVGPGPARDIVSLMARGEGRSADSKNILLLGVGAVGTFLASRLLLGGHRVVVVDLPAQVELIRAVGFRLQTGYDIEAVWPTALADSLEAAFPPRIDYDLMLLATKAYDVAPILRQLPASKFPLPRKVMTIQNGLGAEEMARRLLGENRVLAGSLTVPLSTQTAGSVVVERVDCGLGVATLRAGERVDEWVRMFRRSGIRAQPYADYRAMKWSKLILNIVANATCAILNRKPAAIYGHRPTFNLEHAMLKEALAVMTKLGLQAVDLPGAPARSLVKVLKYMPVALAQRVLEPQIRGGRGDKMPSLHIDLAAGRKESEVVFMNGAVAREGRKLGVPTPVNFVLTDTLHKLFQGVLLWDDFRGKPEALLARLEAEK